MMMIFNYSSSWDLNFYNGLKDELERVITMTEEILENGEQMTDEQIQDFTNPMDFVSEVEENTTNISGVISKDEFTQHFFEFFNMVGDFWNIEDFKIDEHKSFEVAGATVTAEKLYNMADKYPLMHFLIEPSGGWFGDFWLIGWFIYAKSNAVSRKIDGLTLSGRLKKLLKKGGEVTKKASIFTKFFNKEVKNG